ncbi:hypothetical protein [Algoriphagus pacificus]|uniref:LPXTG-motif cell wall anchor domain-containing protein n=1 Tax=Algoriphagus pacificus TaxID=2811234 RepID=A0ABS3CC63_9BACT|nr:hypothetical protein [Algoriphagus pacificus]MBN7814685.1 hypothetical protein [Algoriphagus pacificus]
MNNDLEKKSEELEQTLAKQFDLLKKDSEEWLKIGGIVLVGGLLTYAIVRSKKKKKDRNTDKAIALLEKEGLLTEDLENKLKSHSKSAGIWPSLRQRLLILGLAYAKEKFLPNLFNGDEEAAEKDQ